MAGTFTHWMVVEQALDRYHHLPRKHPYFSIILGLNHFVCLGAVGPDYPYLTELAGGLLKIHSWADRMHYENTGGFVRQGIRSLTALKGEAFNVCLAWLCGFATHLVTDSVIHPVVQAIVGPYVFNGGEHRHCEMIQDSYIFHQIKGVELGYSDYVGLLRMCSDPNDEDKINPDLNVFWTETLKAAHPGATDDQISRINPNSWHKHFLSRIDTAAEPYPVFRHFAEEKNLSYKKTRDITPEEWQRFVNQVKLPGEKTGDFKRDVFDKAVNTAVDTMNRLFIDITDGNSNGPATYIRDWNLDTGVDEDKAYYWT